MWISLIAIFLVGLYRICPHPENVAPIGAMALLGGMFLTRRIAIALPLLILVASDVALNQLMGYQSWYWPRLFDYAAFAAIGSLGWYTRKSTLVLKVGSGLATPFVFFLLSNFGVWLFGLNLAGVPYVKNLAGLMSCYVAAIPFFKGTLVGDWAFISLFVVVWVTASARPGCSWLTRPAPV